MDIRSCLHDLSVLATFNVIVQPSFAVFPVIHFAGALQMKTSAERRLIEPSHEPQTPAGSPSGSSENCSLSNLEWRECNTFNASFLVHPIHKSINRILRPDPEVDRAWVAPYLVNLIKKFRGLRFDIHTYIYT